MFLYIYTYKYTVLNDKLNLCVNFVWIYDSMTTEMEKKYEWSDTITFPFMDEQNIPLHIFNLTTRAVLNTVFVF